MKRKYCIIPLLCLLLCLSLFAGCADQNPPSLRDGGNIVYPGVQWFCSPQELLDALKLSQNDVTIRDDTATAGGQYEILAKGLKLFGDEAGISFSFSKGSDTILRLTQIEAHYDETVDMAAIREKVESSLGAPTEEPADYSGHLAYWDSETTVTTPDGTRTLPATHLSWLDDQQLWLSIKTGTDVDLVKSGVLIFVAVYIPNGKTSSDVHSDVMTDAPLPQWRIPDDFEINRTLSEIRVYPFTEEEIADARKAAEMAIFAQYPGSRTMLINKMAFDPALTDANIRQQLDDAGSLENEDHAYASQITFAVKCLVQYDGEAPNSPPSPNGKTVQITVCRADTSSSWGYLNGSYTTESGKYSPKALRNTDLWPLKDLVPGRLIAGYTRDDFKYDLYYVDLNGQVVFSEGTQTELQRSGTPVDADTLTSLQELFGDYMSWYSQALTSEYSRPEEVDLGMLFYRGVPLRSEVEPAADEVNKLATLSVMWSSEDTCELPVQRISTAQMNDILEQYFGITLDQAVGNGLDWLTYLEDTDCYYTRHSSTNAISPMITAAYLLEDGSIAMYYTESSSIIGNGLAILKPVGGGYQILSNKSINT